MARASCAQCKKQVSYSDPGLDRAGLKSDAWADLVSRTGFLCFDCLGTSDCTKCGVSLGRPNGTINGHDYAGTYCGQPICTSCTKEKLQSQSAPQLIYSPQSDAQKKTQTKFRKGFFGRLIFISGAIALWIVVTLFVGATGEEMALLIVWLPATVYLGYRAIKMLFVGR